MKYEDREKKENLKKTKSERLRSCAEEYVEADSLEEYLLKTTVAGLTPRYVWQDCFWWYYHFENNHIKFLGRIFMLDCLITSISISCFAVFHCYSQYF